MTNQDTQEKMDAVLDAALDDLDDDDGEDEDNDSGDNNDKEHGEDGEKKPETLPSQSSSNKKPVQGPVPPPSPSIHTAGMGIDDMMKQLMLGDSDDGQADEFFGRLLQEMQSQIGAEMDQMEQTSNTSQTTNPSTNKGSAKKKSAQQSTAATSSSNSAQREECDVDQAISSLIEGVTKQATLDEPNMKDEFPGTGMEDEFLKTMMNQLGEGFGEDGVNPDALIDGMMEQLLSKDLMYEPIKKVSEKFPDWLEKNKGKLSDADYDQRCKQYKCFQKLVHIYDTEPENVQTLMLLMQEVQEFGQPPQEIIQDIAPGLELDADGLPKMDGNPGLPFPGGDEDCRIM